MTTLVQRSFAKGELAPALHGRADTVMYALGAKTLENVFVPEEGGAEIRPGSKFIVELTSTTNRAKLFGFDFNETYCLVFMPNKMYVVQDGDVVISLTKNITGITAANPGVVTSNSHGLSTGDVIYLSGISGMTELNGRWVQVGTTATNTFTLKDLEGNNINTSSFTAYSSGGTAQKAYYLSTNYDGADLNELHFNQSADTVTITHQNYPPSNLVRSSDSSWSISEISYGVTISAPTGLTVTRQDSTTNQTAPQQYAYVVTSVLPTGEESLPPSPVYMTQPFAASDQHNTITWTPVTGAVSYRIYRGSGASTPISFGLIGVGNGSTFVDDFPGSVPDYTESPPSRSTEFDPFNKVGTITGITKANPCVITITSHGFNDGDHVKISGVAGMTELNDNDYYVTPASANTVWIHDGQLNYVDSTSYSTYTSGGEMALMDKYPMTSGYYQERLMYANQLFKPMRVIGSRISAYANFASRSPLRDDDPVDFECIGRNGGEIRHIVDVGTLVLLTSKGEHVCQGDANGVLTPENINRKQYSYHGSSSVQPLVVGSTVLTVQAEGSKIIYLGFDQKSGGLNGYKDGNITATAAHLFKGYTIRDWCLQKTPNNIVWAVRSDGVLLGMTFDREQEVVAWHKHETDGWVESVCSVPENGEHVVYAMVRRFINGSVVGRLYLERFYPPSQFKNSTTMFSTDLGTVYMDSAITYDGRNTDATNTMWLTGGSTWGHEETLVLHASNATFTSAHVGKEVHLDDTEQTDRLRLTVTAYTSSTQVSVRPNRTVPTTMRNSGNASYFWAIAANNVTGLHHLEGEAVSVIGDANVIGSPNNTGFDTTYTVDGGTLDSNLDKFYSVIHVGLPFIADIETLDVDMAQGETMMDKKKCVGRVTLRVKDTRGVFVGTEVPDGDDHLEGLNELKLRNSEGYDAATELKTGVVDINIQPQWDTNGHVLVRQVDPLPVNVLSVAVSGMLPVKG